MKKMLNLVANEYIKLMKRKTLWILFILLAVISFGYVGIMAIGNNAVVTIDSVYRYSLADESKYEMDYIEQEYMKKNPDGTYVDNTQYAADQRRQYQILEYYYENNIDSSDWRYRFGVIDNMFSVKFQYEDETDPALKAELKKSYESIKKSVDEDDWKGYYNSFIESKKATIKNDPELLAANIWQYEYAINNNIKPGVEQWKDNILSEVGQAKINIVPLEAAQARGEIIDEAKLEKNKNTEAVGLYRLDHGIEVDIAKAFESARGDTSTFWGVMAQSTLLITFAGISIIIIAGSIVSSEFTQGTIKFLLINPVKRWKILVAKYITVVTVGMLMMAIIFAVCGISTAIMVDAKNIFTPMITATNGVVGVEQPIGHLLVLYLLSGVEVLIMATIAFAVSSAFRSSALSIGISLFSYLSGNLLVLFLHEALGFDWARYLIFANLDLGAIYNGASSFPNHSLIMALAIVVIHWFIFFLAAWDGFTRREV